MRVAFLFFSLVMASLAIFVFAEFDGLSRWVVEQQRGFQNQMAGAARALRAGDLAAYAALLAATGAYGFVHAVGPGHGKYLVGGVGLGTSVTTRKLVALSAISSLLQSVWAILLVYGGFTFLEVSAGQLTYLAEDILAPASYGAIGLVGVILAWRGMRALALAATSPALAHAGHHHHGPGCSHSHGPTREEVDGISTLREAAALVASIAVRPCTGAIFLLVITWQMDIKLAGAIAVLVMGLGTAALTSLVAVSSVVARQAAVISGDGNGLSGIIFPASQVFAGSLIFWISLGFIATAL
ncbi:MAG: hypothetical protein AAGF13_02550 [Pseudomonadota bacterium]